MVDLLLHRHREGRRFEPTEFLEARSRVAVALTVSSRDLVTEAYKVFGYEGAQAVLLQDCTGRDDAVGYLASA